MDRGKEDTTKEMNIGRIVLIGLGILGYYGDVILILIFYPESFCRTISGNLEKESKDTIESVASSSKSFSNRSLD